MPTDRESLSPSIVPHLILKNIRLYDFHARRHRARHSVRAWMGSAEDTRLMRGRSVALSLLLFVFSLALFFGTGELALRVLYRDAGTRTLGGPGGRGFEHLTVDGDQRGALRRRREEPRQAAHPDRRRFDHVGPGRAQLAGHVAGAARRRRSNAPARRTKWRCSRCPVATSRSMSSEVEHWAPQLQTRRLHLPVVRQRHRGRIASAGATRAWWRTGPCTTRCSAGPISYYFRRQPARGVSAAGRSLVPGLHPRRTSRRARLEWAEFERYFHRLAGRAMEFAPTARAAALSASAVSRHVIRCKPIHDRVAALAGKHR